MNDGKRRAPNFSNREKVLLLNIVTDFKNIIENKNTNSQTWREKDETWQIIANRFNSETPESYPRTKDALRKYYDNIKKSLRKNVAEEKMEQRKTGGGSYYINDDPVMELALGLVNPKTVFGLPNQYDSDCIVTEEVTPQNSNNDGNDDHSYTEKVIAIPAQTSGLNITTPTLQKLDTDANGNTGVKNTGKRGFVHVESKQSDALRHVWTKRRRPAIQQLTSSKLSEEYLKLARIKQECYEAEKAGIIKRNQHEEDIFELQKKKLLIEISILKNS